ncbi:hypothetical protein COX08_01210 [Candidatus Beckwithbacteria bacterium CG23_combo_of_CG06-09_8_20_14_all_34_8]|uniref:Glycosyl transferase family 1 domain-containing protein n=1 Tax=Candidatus Beckwithbacteria bacterium CG23_combo_of_CG06-09_8_20_14_all_34_8 TaxID=1974497 RepID=A0A2H0B6Z2_9BACT|nr:MAG: hypothetical protein COX08_01210 [Candidatus Beckwithbacteria bacterium CG23_combo_of_CG06-09_8_20_14_all_34_8]
MVDILIFPQFESFGGAKTYFYHLLKYCIQKKYIVCVILNSYQLDSSLTTFLNTQSIKYIIIPGWFIKLRKLFAKFSEILIIILEIFYAFIYWHRFKPKRILISATKPGQLFGLFLIPTKIIYILHTYPTKNLTIYQNLLLKYKKAKVNLITVSDFSRNQICKYIPIAKENVVAFPPFVNNYQCQKPNKTTGQINILTCGHVIWYKQPDLWLNIALKIVSKYENVNFTWVGSGPDIQKIKNAIPLNYVKRINFVGMKVDLSPFYCKADIYFQPSLIESFGMSVAEAMSASLPVLATDVGALSEVIDQEKTGYLVKNNDQENLIQKLELLINDPKLRQRLGALGSVKFEKQYNFKNWVNKMDQSLKLKP